MRLRALLRNLWEQIHKQPDPIESPVEVLRNGLRIAARRAREKNTPRLRYPVKLPDLMFGVIPEGEKSGIAMDSHFEGNLASYQGFVGHLDGFMGYPRLAMLALRAEYRAMASALSTELTREWITIGSSETAADSTKDRVTQLTKMVDDIRLRDTIQRAAEQDAYFGRAQIAIKIKGHDDELPLVIDKRSIGKGSFERVVTVESIWTTPAAYNASDPLAKDFYKPPMWYVLGKKIHASRLLTVITRQVPDMLKPAFNFGGVPLTQLAEAYVDNWLRTRQAVADLVDNFSITALATNMGQTLTSEEGDGEDLFNRAELFTAMRSNRGLMVFDKDTEDLKQLNVPLSGLDKLQAQAQEHMCAVSRIPAVVLTGIDPTGLNPSSEGTIRVFYDWIAALQEAHWRCVIDTILKVLMLSMFGEIDEDIHFSFNPLYQMTAKELSDIRKTDAEAAGVYIDRGVIAPEEERERIARNPESGYNGLDLDIEIENPNLEEDKDEEDSHIADAA